MQAGLNQLFRSGYKLIKDHVVDASQMPKSLITGLCALISHHQLGAKDIQAAAKETLFT